MRALLEHQDLWDTEAGAPGGADPKQVRKALSLLLLNVKDHHLQSLAKCKTAAEAWTQLKTVHVAQSTARQM